jgi:hypothetical protein
MQKVNYAKAMAGFTFTDRRKSKSLDGENDFKDNFEDNLPADENNEGDDELASPITQVEETPMQRLIKALK